MFDVSYAAAWERGRMLRRPAGRYRSDSIDGNAGPRPRVAASRTRRVAPTPAARQTSDVDTAHAKGNRILVQRTQPTQGCSLQLSGAGPGDAAKELDPFFPRLTPSGSPAWSTAPSTSAVSAKDRQNCRRQGKLLRAFCSARPSSSGWPSLGVNATGASLLRMESTVAERAALPVRR